MKGSVLPFALLLTLLACDLDVDPESTVYVVGRILRTDGTGFGGQRLQVRGERWIDAGERPAYRRSEGFDMGEAVTREDGTFLWATTARQVEPLHQLVFPEEPGGHQTTLTLESRTVRPGNDFVFVTAANWDAQLAVDVIQDELVFEARAQELPSNSQVIVRAWNDAESPGKPS